MGHATCTCTKFCSLWPGFVTSPCLPPWFALNPWFPSYEPWFAKQEAASCDWYTFRWFRCLLCDADDKHTVFGLRLYLGGVRVFWKPEHPFSEPVLSPQYSLWRCWWCGCTCWCCCVLLGFIRLALCADANVQALDVNLRHNSLSVVDNTSPDALMMCFFPLTIGANVIMSSSEKVFNIIYTSNRRMVLSWWDLTHPVVTRTGHALSLRLSDIYRGQPI